MRHLLPAPGSAKRPALIKPGQHSLNTPQIVLACFAGVEVQRAAYGETCSDKRADEVGHDVRPEAIHDSPFGGLCLPSAGFEPATPALGCGAHPLSYEGRGATRVSGDLRTTYDPDPRAPISTVNSATSQFRKEKVTNSGELPYWIKVSCSCVICVQLAEDPDGC